jgi:hypothetical protein
MRSYHVVLILSAAAVLIGCGEHSSPSAPAGVLESAGNLGDGGIVTSTTGEGEAQLPAGFSAEAFSFSAVQHPDGTAHGRFFHRRSSASGIVDFDGDVTCVAVDPVNHRAWIGGRVTANRSTNPAFLTAINEVGDDLWFRVVDNGEGTGNPPDRTTILGFESAAIPSSAFYCATMPWTAGDANTFPVVEGNIQVRSR